MPDRKLARERMVRHHLAGRGIGDPLVLGAMGEVPRECFVPEDLQDYAYEDAPLSIGAGQTISQPFIVALMIASAAIRPGDRVLEVGAGSGYAAAVMSRIAGKVHAIERHAELTLAAGERLRRLGYRNILLRTGDGTEGWPEAAPFDAILVAAGGPAVPASLQQQLEIGGRLVMPVGSLQGEQRLIKVTRVSEAEFQETDLGAVTFVPLIGRHGWPEPEAPLGPPG